jgi:hypothetical protein
VSTYSPTRCVFNRKSFLYTLINVFLLPQAIFDAEEGAPLLGVDHTINMEVGV